METDEASTIIRNSSPHYKFSDFSDVEQMYGDDFLFRANSGTFGEVVIKKYHCPQRGSITDNAIELTLKHPNIVQIFGLIKDDNNYVYGIFMEYMASGNLHEVIHDPQKSYSTKQVYSWIIQISRALRYLRERDIIHRDLKPHNMLLGSSIDQLKLCDFQFTRKIDESSLTGCVGTTVYMAPEILMGKHYTATADIYSFTISIWEMLHRRRPYDVEISNFLFIRDLVEGKRPDINLQKIELEMLTLFKRGWDKNPSQRPTLEEFIDFVKRRSSAVVADPTAKASYPLDLIIDIAPAITNNSANITARQSAVILETVSLDENATSTIPHFKDSYFCNKKVIGEGGEGIVSRAECQKFGVVAVKIFFTRIIKAKEALNRNREIAILLELDHPHVIKLFGIIIDDSDKKERIGFAMEHMQLGSLHSVIHNPRKPDNYATYIYSWINQACLGLQYLHDQKIVHRDINPKNLLLQSMDVLKLADFGIARDVGVETFTGEAGTYIYMAPEVFRGDKMKLGHGDPQTVDVYSLTITIWEIVHKKKPYNELGDVSAFAIGYKVASEGLRPTINPNCVDAELTGLLKRGWHAEPSQRLFIAEIAEFAVRRSSMAKTGETDQKFPVVSRRCQLL